jgi:MYXO-CTERM domain-containing protein
MTTRTKLTVGALVIGIHAITAPAAVLVQDNFDSYANQAAFEATWTPIGTVAPVSAELSTLQASSGPNSVRVPGTAVNSQSRNRLTFAESGSLATLSLITWSFDFYDSAPTASPQRNYANLQDTTAPGSTGQLLAMGFNNNQSGANSGGQYYMARILGYTVPTTADPEGGPTESVGGAGAFFKLNDFGVGLRTLGWHNLKMEISSDDGLSADFAFYVDNILAERVLNVGTAASFRSYDNITIGSGLSNGSTEAFFDNMSLEVTAVPEPSVAAVGLVGLGLFFGCRRRR